jgi:hypothetical protein
MASSNLNIKQLILIPAIISLGVTILRLVGELNNWSPLFFNREAGGGMAIVGVAWLVPIFGVYFALKLVKMGHGPTSGWRAAGFSLLAIVVLFAIFFVVTQITTAFAALMGAGVVAAAAAIFVASKGWPALFKTLLAYGFAVRIPVAIVMLIAIFSGWGTHYEAGPPNTPAMSPFVKWVVIGLIPQMTSWIAYTVVLGGLFGGIAAALVGKGTKEAAQTA